MAITPFGQEIRDLAQNVDKRTAPFGKTVSEMAHAKKAGDSASLEAAIVDSNLSITVGDQQNSLALVLKAAIEGINAALEPVFGANAIQATRDSGVDVSPEATAERIVNLSTGFFGAYQEANPELDFATALTQFTSLISGGIDKGFEDAKGILESLQVLDGEIATNIDATYQLVQDKLAAFIANIEAANKPPAPSAAEQLGTE